MEIVLPIDVTDWEEIQILTVSPVLPLGGYRYKLLINTMSPRVREVLRTALSSLRFTFTVPCSAEEMYAVSRILEALLRTELPSPVHIRVTAEQFNGQWDLVPYLSTFSSETNGEYLSLLTSDEDSQLLTRIPYGIGSTYLPQVSNEGLLVEKYASVIDSQQWYLPSEKRDSLRVKYHPDQFIGYTLLSADPKFWTPSLWDRYPPQVQDTVLPIDGLALVPLPTTVEDRRLHTQNLHLVAGLISSASEYVVDVPAKDLLSWYPHLQMFGFLPAGFHPLCSRYSFFQGPPESPFSLLDVLRAAAADLPVPLRVGRYDPLSVPANQAYLTLRSWLVSSYQLPSHLGSPAVLGRDGSVSLPFLSLEHYQKWKNQNTSTLTNVASIYCRRLPEALVLRESLRKVSPAWLILPSLTSSGFQVIGVTNERVQELLYSYRWLFEYPTLDRERYQRLEKEAVTLLASLIRRSLPEDLEVPWEDQLLPAELETVYGWRDLLAPQPSLPVTSSQIQVTPQGIVLQVGDHRLTVLPGSPDSEDLNIISGLHDQGFFYTRWARAMLRGAGGKLSPRPFRELPWAGASPEIIQRTLRRFKSSS